MATPFHPSIQPSNHPSLNNQQLAYKLVDGVGGSGKPEGWEGGREKCVLWASSGCCLSNHRQVLHYVSLSVTQLENSLRSTSPHHSTLRPSSHQESTSVFTNPYPFDSHSTLPFLSVFLSPSGGVEGGSEGFTSFPSSSSGSTSWHICFLLSLTTDYSQPSTNWPLLYTPLCPRHFCPVVILQFFLLFILLGIKLLSTIWPLKFNLRDFFSRIIFHVLRDI